MTDDIIDLTDAAASLPEPVEVVAAATPHVAGSTAVASLARAYQRAAWDLACGPRHPRGSCSPSP